MFELAKVFESKVSLEFIRCFIRGALRRFSLSKTLILIRDGEEETSKEEL